MHNFCTALHKITNHFSLRTTLAWCLDSSSKWWNLFSDKMMKMCNSKLGSSSYDKVQSPKYGWLRYSGNGWQKKREKEGGEEKEHRQLQSITHFTQTQEVNLAIYIVWQWLENNISSPVSYSYLSILADDNANIFAEFLLKMYCGFSSLIWLSIVMTSFYIISKRLCLKCKDYLMQE